MPRGFGSVSKQGQALVWEGAKLPMLYCFAKLSSTPVVQGREGIATVGPCAEGSTSSHLQLE